jgi:hypothetical protein
MPIIAPRPDVVVPSTRTDTSIWVVALTSLVVLISLRVMVGAVGAFSIIIRAILAVTIRAILTIPAVIIRTVLTIPADIIRTILTIPAVIIRTVLTIPAGVIRAHFSVIWDPWTRS